MLGPVESDLAHSYEMSTQHTSLESTAMTRLRGACWVEAAPLLLDAPTALVDKRKGGGPTLPRDIVGFVCVFETFLERIPHLVISTCSDRHGALVEQVTTRGRAMLALAELRLATDKNIQKGRRSETGKPAAVSPCLFFFDFRNLPSSLAVCGE